MRVENGLLQELPMHLPTPAQVLGPEKRMTDSSTLQGNNFWGFEVADIREYIISIFIIGNYDSYNRQIYSSHAPFVFLAGVGNKGNWEGG